ncbi:hypothetical protein [Salipiger bermudensis]|uniref:hypothetical protein n=1 Tax=Salipiger bermudensis TaxID=344736 RepID=UPI001CD4F8AC|nr:hypothetical protein [Salipiger bermudensis]MCA0960620.1 hypothetical protein [Salipiger bermudensis]
MIHPAALVFAFATLSLTAAAHAASLPSGQNTLSADNAHPYPGAAYQGQVYVTPGGCSYSRAQVPGYEPTWHLILNGAAAGLTDAHRRCPTMLGDYERL